MPPTTNIILTPTAPGELIDKITILGIKKERITNPERLENIGRELELLEDVRNKHFPQNAHTKEQLAELESALKKTNEVIWDMSETLRIFGEKEDFGADFVKVAYGIHTSNDERARLKKEINLMLNSPIIEEKSYKHWK
jgi:hypothetical protein